MGGTNEPFAHFRSEIGKDEIDGKHSESGLFEIRFARVKEHQALPIVPPRGAHELDGKSDHRKPIRRDYGLSLDFCTRRPAALTIRNSCGV